MNLKDRNRIVVLALATLLAGCSDATEPGGAIFLDFDFHTDGAWIADFADVSVAAAPQVGFLAEHRALPAPLDVSRKGLYHEGNNVSDNLFMYFRKRIDELDPERWYRASFELSVATRRHADCAFGAPEIDVKAGVTATEPVRAVVLLDAEPFYVPMAAIGDPASDGQSAVYLGDIRNQLPGCPELGTYQTKVVTSGSRGVLFKPRSDGSAWLFFGTDSAFETPHDLYFLRLRVRLTPV